MNRMCWWLAHRLSRGLESGERDAVLGDIAEAGEAGGEALLDLLSLTIRRQAALWSTARTWLAPAGLIAPVGMLVGGWSSGRRGFNWLGWVIGQIHTLLSQGVFGESGMTPADNVVRLVGGVFLIAGWAVIGGFVLGSVLRRSAGIYAALACVVWWFAIVIPFGVPVRAIFRAPLWQTLFWLAVQAILIVIPFLWGVRRGTRVGFLGWSQMALVVSAMASLTLIMQVEDSRQTLAYALWGNGESLGWQMVWTPHVLPFFAILWEFAILSAAKEKNT
ncbi:MAG TPA: hypothetical protein VGG72_15405 [Bryobacteraceae bacterium]